eukprot:scaffold116143_cov31-Tisochrysis_lutea.AAC.1
MPSRWSTVFSSTCSGLSSAGGGGGAPAAGRWYRLTASAISTAGYFCKWVPLRCSRTDSSRNFSRSVASAGEHMASRVPSGGGRAVLPPPCAHAPPTRESAPSSIAESGEEGGRGLSRRRRSARAAGGPAPPAEAALSLLKSEVDFSNIIL